MKSFRSQVFKRAHVIARNTGKAFAICLVKAWQIFRLKKRMARESVKFAYEKADGTLRYALGTLSGNYEIKGTGIPTYKTMAYYDMEANGFRSFKVENLIAIY